MIMYSVKKNGEVVALFIEESDAEGFHRLKTEEYEEELLEQKTLEYLAESGEKELGLDVFLMISGIAATETAKTWAVVKE